MEGQTSTASINNAFYDELLDDWYEAYNHPVALLRAENKVRNPWIAQEIEKTFTYPVSILDIGCGAGLLTNFLASKKHQVTGIDLSEPSLAIAKKNDLTKTVRYLKANAYELPFPDEHFDVVSAMDVLEHVDNPEKLVQEASRVLKKNGLFFFHTFNRNFFSYLLVIKGVDWCVQNAPKNMHIYSLFIKPQEMRQLCNKHLLKVQSIIGLRPKMNRAFFQMLFTRKVPQNFTFQFSKNLSTGYCGISSKMR